MNISLLVVAAALLPVTAGAESLSVRAAALPAMSVARGAQRVPMMTVELRAPCSTDVRVRSMRLSREGRGAAEDLLRIYALSGALRLGRPAAVQARDGSVTLRFSALRIARCTSKTFSIAADISPSALSAGEHRLVLRSAADIQADVPVTLQASASPGVVRTVGPAKGNVQATVLAPRVFPVYGAGRIVARLQLEADEALRLSAVTFLNDGSARDADLQNIALYSGVGTRVTNVAPSLDGDRVRLVFDPPLSMTHNALRLFTLRADVRASRRRTIEFVVESPSDVETLQSVRR